MLTKITTHPCRWSSNNKWHEQQQWYTSHNPNHNNSRSVDNVTVAHGKPVSWTVYSDHHYQLPTTHQKVRKVNCVWMISEPLNCSLLGPLTTVGTLFSGEVRKSTMRTHAPVVAIQPISANKIMPVTPPDFAISAAPYRCGAESTSNSFWPPTPHAHVTAHNT